jgi:hypothetical protein
VGGERRDVGRIDRGVDEFFGEAEEAVHRPLAFRRSKALAAKLALREGLLGVYPTTLGSPRSTFTWGLSRSCRLKGNGPGFGS